MRLTKEKIDKIIKESIESLINESLTNKAYHFTKISNLLNIVKNNYLITSRCDKIDYKINYGYDRYVSFTRMKNGNAGYSEKFDARITVDSDKINYKYKVKSVDYFNASNLAKKPITHFSDDLGYNSKDNRGASSEGEDRILTNNDKIENFNDYILRIDMLINHDYDLKELERQYDNISDNILRKTYVYYSLNDFRNGNKHCLNLYYDKNSIFNNFYNNNNVISYNKNFLIFKNMNNNKYMIANKKGELFSDLEYDSCDIFNPDVCIVQNNNKTNFINKNGNFLFDKWFDYILISNDHKYNIVKYGNAYNILDINLKPIFNNDMDNIYYISGFYRLEKNGEYNLMDNNGNILFPNWMDIN